MLLLCALEDFPGTYISSCYFCLLELVNPQKHCHFTVLLIVNCSSPIQSHIGSFMAMNHFPLLSHTGSDFVYLSQQAHSHHAAICVSLIITLQHTYVCTQMKQPWLRLELITECLQYLTKDWCFSLFSHVGGYTSSLLYIQRIEGCSYLSVQSTY